MSRIQAGALSVHLDAVALDEVVARRAARPRTSPDTVDVPEDLPLVLADAGLLERVVANLVDNARRFSPGRRRSRSRPARPDTDLGACSTSSTTGPASRPAMGRHVRAVPDDWATATPRRLGLGLAIARGFTEAMKAELEPSATPGRRADHDADLPVAAMTSILIVEDDPQLLRALSINLRAREVRGRSRRRRRRPR